MTDTVKADEVVNHALAQLVEHLEKAFGSDLITIKSPIYLQLDDSVRIQIENLVEKRNKAEKKRARTMRSRLTVVLETNGGYVEVVERISNVFRKHYEEVEFVVPNSAYSAGTVLALSGDRIWMDYYSVLGPIDPQVQNESGKFIPGMGYLYKYQELMEKKKLSQAEALFLVKRFDPAELFVIEQSKNHAEELIRKWLVQYKFKNWKRTTDKKRPVTTRMKERRAAQIAEVLGNAGKWHSHGRGLTMRDLRGDDIKLEIDDFGTDDKVSDLVRQYYDLFIDYCGRMKIANATHTRFGLHNLR